MVRLSRRLIFWVGGSLAGLIALLAIALVVAVAVIDPNRFKGRIIELAREQTGRELTLTGDLAWRVFPWLVVRTGEGQLGNPAPQPGAAPGVASEASFARWQSLRLGVRLFPLIRRRQLIFDRITVAGLQLHLHRDAAGLTNWSFAGQHQASPADEGAAIALQVDEIELRKSQILFDDDQANTHWRATQVDLDAGIPAGTTTEKLTVTALRVAARLFGGPLASAGVPVEFAAPQLAYETAASAFAVPQWSARFGAAQLNGSLEGSTSAPARVAGSLQLKSSSLREVLASLGIEAPATRDAAALGRIELNGTVSYAHDALQVAPVTLRLDDTNLSGTLGIPSLKSGLIVFALMGDRIRVDRYLTPEDVVTPPFELPVAQLKALQADGIVSFDSAQLAGATLRGLRLKLVTKPGDRAPTAANLAP